MKGDALDEKVKKLNFSVEMSMRYHQRRRGFCEWSHNVIMFSIIILGSAAFSELVQGWHHYFVFLATSLAAFDLVWKPSHRSRDHEVLFRRFSDLAIDLRTNAPSEENYAKWKKARIAIEADEPPVYWALAEDCHNEVIRLTDKPFNLVDIPLYRRMTMNVLRYAGTRSLEAKSSA